MWADYWPKTHACHIVMAQTEGCESPIRTRWSLPSHGQYNFCKPFCERADNLAKLQQALGEAAGRPVSLQLATSENDTSPPRRTSKCENRRPHGRSLTRKPTTPGSNGRRSCSTRVWFGWTNRKADSA